MASYDRDVVKFSDEFIDELKSRLRLSDVIGKSVKLRRQGREYVGLSPFTKERTPSFYVNDDKGFFHDFSSGKHGDLISFFQETERLSFVEAIERLASEAGMALPAPDPRSAARDQERQGLASWIEQASHWFESELRRPVGREARSYLQKRGLGENEWPRFYIGYAPPSRTGLKDYLVAKGARVAELVHAGLLVSPDDGSPPYDRFRDRVIFPISDERGRVISFGGRALNPDVRAKYINGSDSPLFDKGRVLYGFSEARRLLRESKSDETPLVVVEGYMDVIACQRAGVPAVASMGTSLTEAQVEGVWRIHREPTLCFDADRAGRLAAGRAIDRLLPMLKSTHTVKFTSILGGKDADDVFREQGPEALRQQLSTSVGFADALFRREFDAEPLDSPERRAAFRARLIRAAGSVTDRDLAEQYRNHLLDAFYGFFGKKRAAESNKRFDIVDSLKSVFKRGEFPDIQDRVRTLNAAVAVAAVWHPKWLDGFVEQFEGFGDKHLAELVQPLLDALQESHPTYDLVMQNIRSDAGTLYAYERACHFAEEVGRYPFLVQGDEGERFHAMWLSCFEAIRELSAIEHEKRERHQSHEAERKKPASERTPLVDGAYHFKRGVWLREHEQAIANRIHSGELWGMKVQDR